MAVPAAAVASSSASSAGAGAAGGPIALAVVLALVITKEIFKARRTARREMLAKKYPPIQVETAAQRLKNLLGENGEALAVAQILTPEQQMQMGVLQPDFSYSYSEPVSTQQIPRSRQQILQDLGISSTERQQELRAKTGPIQAPGKTNPNWAQDLAHILLNITGGNLNKLNPNSLPYNEYYNLMMKVASGEADSVYKTFKKPDCFKNETGWTNKWMDEVGAKIYDMAINHPKGFSPHGAILILAQAYNEQATTESARNTAYKDYNWWNMMPLTLRKEKKSTYRTRNFAGYGFLKEAFEAYVWRMTSTPNVVSGSIQKGTFNPSYPKFGELLKQNNFPTEDEILKALRMKQENGDWGGELMYCTESDGVTPCKSYGKDLLSLAEIVKKDFIKYLTAKMQCYQNEIENLIKLREGYLQNPISPNMWDPYSSQIQQLENEINEMQKLQNTINNL